MMEKCSGFDFLKPWYTLKPAPAHLRHSEETQKN